MTNKDEVILTDDQRKAFERISNFFNSPFSNIFLLQGYAGTGKTFLSIRLVEYLSEDFSNKIIITAPTHKALKVLKDELNLEYLNVDFATIHSAFGLREFIDGYGNLIFIPDKNIKPKINNFNILIVDEVSMLEDDLFYRIIKRTENNKNFKVLLIGDPAQIPPVNRLDSLPFDIKSQSIFKIEKYIFTEIIRQKYGHPIIEIATNVRNNLLEEQVFISSQNKKTKLGNVQFLDFKKNEEEFISLLHEKFTSTEFENDSDYSKVLAWTNQTVDNMNDVIRSMIFNDQIGKLLPREKIIMDTPWVVNDKVIFNNNDELEVKQFTIRQLNVPSMVTMKYYDTTVIKKTYDGKTIQDNIKVIHEDSELAYENQLDLLKKIAKKEQQGTFNARKKWIKYYENLNIFAHIKYNYALTCHKSQGSTYKNVFLLNFDVDFNNRIRERNRIKYTAITRPKENLYIIQ